MLQEYIKRLIDILEFPSEHNVVLLERLHPLRVHSAFGVVSEVLNVENEY